jgi:hypothetical protein
VDGRFKDVWFDDLLPALRTYVKLEAVNNPDFVPRRASALIPSDLTTAPLEVLAGVLSRGSDSREVSEAANGIAACLERELGVRGFPAPVLARQLRHFRWSRRLYAAVLARVRPRHVLTADPGEHALTAAAKDRGIEVVELQHGFLDRVSHPSYGWTEYAAPYKRRMTVADRLFLYGEHWKAELAANGFWGDEALRAVGSPRVDQYRRLRAASPRRTGPTIVFATQGLEVARAAAFVAEFLELARDDAGLSLAIKLHPLYDRDPAPYLAAVRGDPRVRVLTGAEGETTFELLARADLHLSVSSTCHYEALGLGVPTVVLPFATHEIMRPLVAAGHATLVRTPGELLEVARGTGRAGAPDSLSDYYFTSGALDNMVRELGEAG